uniref:Ig-like domain-containing protein n=1 Tax=Pavo cristatus TaxID=9049 RepID=A0A8C9F3E2_PAVCR
MCWLCPGLCFGAAPQTWVLPQKSAPLAEAHTVTAGMEDNSSACCSGGTIGVSTFIFWHGFGSVPRVGFVVRLTARGRGRAEPWAQGRRLQALLLFPVPPSVSVVAAPSGAVEVNKTVNFTCRVQGFYPGAVSITWLENGTEMNAGSTTQPTETSRGLFELNSTVTVQAGEEKNGSKFTCRVVHEDQEPIASTESLIYVAVGVVCTVLALLVIAILYLIRTKQSKGKDKETT